MRKIFTLLYAFFVLGLCVAEAQNGANDLTFNPSDTGYSNGTDSSVHSISLQTDGKIILGGYFEHYLTVPKRGIVRINADETLDNSFQIGTGALGVILSTAIQPDGKILAGGEFGNFNGYPSKSLVRLNTDGSVDATFNAGGSGFDSGNVQKILLQSDGKILLAGWFSSYNGQDVPNVIRLNADGSLDAGFNAANADGGDFIFDMAFAADGKIVIVGGINVTTDPTKRCMARLNTNGSLDAAFSPVFQGYNLLAVAIQTDGKICVGGHAYYDGATSLRRVTRYNADGTLDAAFNPTNGFDAMVSDIAIQPDGKILCAGDESMRLNADGSLDNTFMNFQSTLDIYRIGVSAIAYTEGGKILLGGDFLTYNDYSENYVTRLNPDGTRDATFDAGNGTGADNFITTIDKQADGKIVITGSFDHYNGITRKRIARLDENGLPDATFNPGAGVDGYVWFSQIGADGKIVIVGDFTHYDGQEAKKIARINPNGSLDTSFATGTGFNLPNFGSLSAFAIQPDGKILVAGDFTAYNGTACHTMVRLNVDGALDASFTPAFLSFPDQRVRSITALPQQRILIAMSNSSTGPQNTLVRTDAFGNLDPSFTPLTEQNIREVDKIALEQDGSILVTGSYIGSNPFGNYRFLRLGQNGGVTQLFGDSIYPILWGMYPQADGKIIVTGLYYSALNLPQKSISRLYHDGTVDDSFTGPQELISIYDMVPQQDNWVFIGNFTSVDGVGRNRIARFESEGALSLPHHVSASDKVKVVKSHRDIFVESESTAITSVVVYDFAGRKLASDKGFPSQSVQLKVNDPNAVVIVRTVLEDGSVHVKKLF